METTTEFTSFKMNIVSHVLLPRKLCLHLSTTVLPIFYEVLFLFQMLSFSNFVVYFKSDCLKKILFYKYYLIFLVQNFTNPLYFLQFYCFFLCKKQ